MVRARDMANWFVSYQLDFFGEVSGELAILKPWAEIPQWPLDEFIIIGIPKLIFLFTLVNSQLICP